MNIELLSKNYPQIDITKKHKLHIKLSEDEKWKLLVMSEKLQQSESKCCIQIINAQIDKIEEKTVSYNFQDFQRKNGEYKFDVTVVLPAILYLRLLYLKETFQSFSIGLIVRMMFDEFLDSINDEDDELAMREKIDKHGEVVNEEHSVFLKTKFVLATICDSIVSRISRFFAGLSDEMASLWREMFADGKRDVLI